MDQSSRARGSEGAWCRIACGINALKEMSSGPFLAFVVNYEPLKSFFFYVGVKKAVEHTNACYSVRAHTEMALWLIMSLEFTVYSRVRKSRQEV